MPDTLCAAQARSLALNAQGFCARPAPSPITRGAIARGVSQLGLVQMDSVNVLVRSHYLPVFSRLGAYAPEHLDRAAYDGKRRALFEYWGHEASLIPVGLHPLFRWRMARAQAGQGLWSGPFRFAQDNPRFIQDVLAQLRARGPLSASALDGGGKSEGAWWGWSAGKRALEYLFWTGAVTTATRRGAFERIYGLTEDVLPASILNLPTPGEADAQRALIRIAAQALGVATAKDLRDYFRLGVADAAARIAELAEEGDLVPVAVEGWRQQAYRWRAARPARRAARSAFLSPFDNLIWERDRTERLFGVRIKLEIYTPAAQRTHGYYVLPFLMDGRIAARADLKADRKAGALLVQAAHLEPGWRAAEVAPRMAASLAELAAWLGLGAVAAAGASAFARTLAQHAR
jgi:hypothetical protein